MSDESYCDVTERLFGEFERDHAPAVRRATGRLRVDQWQLPTLQGGCLR